MGPGGGDWELGGSEIPIRFVLGVYCITLYIQAGNFFRLAPSPVTTKRFISSLYRITLYIQAGHLILPAYSPVTIRYIALLRRNVIQMKETYMPSSHAFSTEFITPQI